MQRILITGANSFIGTNFRKYSSHKIIDEISLLDKDPGSIDFHNYDIVLHLSAIVHQSRKIPESEYFRVNRDLCLQIAENAKNQGVSHFIFLSTLKVYGNLSPGNKLKNEFSECNPDDSYGRSKFEAELGLKKMESPSFIVSIIRTPLVYGEGVRANMLKMIRLVYSFPILPFGRIDNRRVFTNVENLVCYIDRIIECKCPGTFIVKDENAVSTTELVKYLAGAFGKKMMLVSLPGIIRKTAAFCIPGLYERLFGSMEIDNSWTKEKLDLCPPVSLTQGVQKMIGFYLKSKNQGTTP